MKFDLNKACIIRQEQTDALISFRVCFADEHKNWVGFDLTVPKYQFVDVAKLDQSSFQCAQLDEKVFNLDRVKIGWKSSSLESPEVGEPK